MLLVNSLFGKSRIEKEIDDAATFFVLYFPLAFCVVIAKHTTNKFFLRYNK